MSTLFGSALEKVLHDLGIAVDMARTPFNYLINFKKWCFRKKINGWTFKIGSSFYTSCSASHPLWIRILNPTSQGCVEGGSEEERLGEDFRIWDKVLCHWLSTWLFLKGLGYVGWDGMGFSSRRVSWIRRVMWEGSLGVIWAKARDLGNKRERKMLLICWM
jgi:hypothetical protein